MVKILTYMNTQVVWKHEKHTRKDQTQMFIFVPRYLKTQKRYETNVEINIGGIFL